MLLFKELVDRHEAHRVAVVHGVEFVKSEPGPSHHSFFQRSVNVPTNFESTSSLHCRAER